MHLREPHFSFTPKNVSLLLPDTLYCPTGNYLLLIHRKFPFILTCKAPLRSTNQSTWQQGIPFLFLGNSQAGGQHHFCAENLPLKPPISRCGFFVSVSSQTGSQINGYSRRIPLQRAVAQITSTVCQLLSLRIIFLAVAAASKSCIPMRVLPIVLNIMQWYHWPPGFGRDWKDMEPQLFLSLFYRKQNLLLLGNCCRDIRWTFCFPYLLLFKALHIPCPLSNSLITILSVARTFIVPPVIFMWSGCLISCH